MAKKDKREEEKHEIDQGRQGEISSKKEVNGQLLLHNLIKGSKAVGESDESEIEDAEFNVK